MKTRTNPILNRGRYSKSEERIEKILDATIEIIAQDGYTHFSLRTVANRAGYRLGGVQHFFPTKDELLEAALARDIGRYERNMDEIAEQLDVSAEDRFAELVRVHFDASMDPFVSSFFLSFWALGAHDNFAQELQNELYENAVKRIAGVITELNPRLTKRDCTNRAILAMSMLEGTVVLCGSNTKFNSRKNAVRKLLHSRLIKICIDD